MDEDSANEWLLRSIPGVVFLIYAWFVVAEYSELLNWDLTYRRAELAGAPEDVLGIGFVLPWLIFCCFFVVALCAALVGAKHRLRFAIAWT